MRGGRWTDHARRWRRRWLVRHLDDLLELGLRSLARCWRLDYVDDFWRGRCCGNDFFLNWTSFLDLRGFDATTTAHAAPTGGCLSRRGRSGWFGGWSTASASWCCRRFLLAMALLTFPADTHARHLIVR
jgi:hypothetical protein